MTFDVLAGGGRMGAAMRAFDWAGSPLGEPRAWPQPLKTLVALMLAADQPMFVGWGPDHRLLYNDAYAPMLADRHPEALGRPFLEVWSEVRRDLAPLFETVGRGEPVHMDDITLQLDRPGRDPEAHFAFGYTPVRDESGAVAGLFCACTETTEEVQARRQSAKERTRLFKMTRDLFGVATFDGRLETINPAWSSILSRTDEELLSRPFAEIVHPDDLETTGAVVQMLMRGEPVHQFHVRLLRADGAPVSFAWSAVPDDTPGSRLFYTVGRDITEDLRREEMLRQSQKMEAVGQLTGGLAHDFNNLLAGISGSLELMKARLEQGRVSDVDRYLTAAYGASKRAAALTHRLLAFSRRQTLMPRPTDVNRLVADMEELVQRTVGPAIAVEVVGSVGLWPALVDPSQLENALLNLCINARDAMPDGGKITVETANKWLDRWAAHSHAVPEGQYLSICVTDTGKGMSPEVVERAFEPFFTTKPIGEGTGLGLSMIYGFAQQSGGQVRIYSEVGQGTTVCIYLPRHYGESVVEEELGSTTLPRSKQGETVLIVDDEPTVRMLLTEVLSDLGYTAMEAADSQAGLKLLQSNARIDLLVTDVGLPGGLNGRQMADAALVFRPDLKVLFITGYAENAVVGNGHLDPGMEIMAKPFAMSTLGNKVREMIES